MPKTHKIAFGIFLSLAVFMAWTRFSRPPDAIQARVEKPSVEAPVDVPQTVIPPPAPTPLPQTSVLTQLRLESDPRTLIVTVRQLPGVEKAEFNAKSSTHADPEKPSTDRVVNIDRLEFTAAGKLRVIGPTRSPQRIPRIKRSLHHSELFDSQYRFMDHHI